MLIGNDADDKRCYQRGPRRLVRPRHDRVGADGEGVVADRQLG
ncbi:MAG TPA: hypothetical protein VK001_05690 [Geminicoccaceae bacterium]|nr:hypothetical protein [Geminicoccaceae bacterium]